MRWKMVPVSVAAHVTALLACVVIPLDSSIDLPTPWPSSVSVYMAASAAPPPPAITPRAESSSSPSTAAPLVAPDRIAASEETPSVGPITEGSIPNFSGAVSGIGEGILPEVYVAPVALPPTPAPPAVVRPGGVIREPRKIVNVAPVYPEIARISKVEGLVIIEATIDERGHVMDARVLRSAPLLDTAALAAIRQWRYTPTLLNGVPVRVLMTVTIRFSLGNQTP